MSFLVAPGTTSVSLDVFFADDTGAAVTGQLAADFPACKWSGGSNTADTAIVLSDLALITSAHSAGGIKEREGGWYRLDLPNAMIASVGRKTLTFAESAGKRIIAPTVDCQVLADPLLSTVPGTYTQPQAGWVLGQLLSMDITYTGPVNPVTGDAAITRGDDYYTADGRGIILDVPYSSGNPDLTGATIVVDFYAPGDTETTLSVTASVSNPGTSTQQVTIELSSSDTASLTEPRYIAVLMATLATTHTDRFGRMTFNMEDPRG